MVTIMVVMMLTMMMVNGKTEYSPHTISESFAVNCRQAIGENFTMGQVQHLFSHCSPSLRHHYENLLLFGVASQKKDNIMRRLNRYDGKRIIYEHLSE